MEKIQEKIEAQNLRVVTFDFLRGIAIALVVVFHALAFDIFDGNLPDSKEVPIILQIFAFPFMVFGTWASLFALITGASTTYVMYYQISHGKTTLQKRLKKSIVSSLIIMGINFIYLFFFIHPIKNINGLEQEGMITGSLRGDGFYIPNISILLLSGALSMIAFSDLFVTGLFALIWRNNGIEKLKRNYRILMLFGFSFVLGAPTMQNWLVPKIYNAQSEDNWLLTMLYTWLVGTRHPIFPFVGYAFFGGMFGMAMGEKNRDLAKIQHFGHSIGGTFLFISFVDVWLNGFPNIMGLWHPFALYTFNLGVMMLLVTFLLERMDFVPMNERPTNKWLKNSIGIRRFGMVSLSIFIFESAIASLYSWIWKLAFPNILFNPFFVFLFYTPLLGYIYWKVLKRWEKHNFYHSLEWRLATLGMSRKPDASQDFLKINDILYKTWGMDRNKIDIYMKPRNSA